MARERDALFGATAEAARRALALDPDNAAAHALLAYGAMKRHRWEEAEAGFTRALALAPNDGEVVKRWALAGLGIAALTGIDPRSTDD